MTKLQNSTYGVFLPSRSSTKKSFIVYQRRSERHKSLLLSLSLFHTYCSTLSKNKRITYAMEYSQFVRTVANNRHKTEKPAKRRRGVAICIFVVSTVLILILIIALVSFYSKHFSMTTQLHITKEQLKRSRAQLKVTKEQLRYCKAQSTLAGLNYTACATNDTLTKPHTDCIALSRSNSLT